MSSVKKCLVWDLDNTLWEGILLEGDVRLRQEAVETISELDRRGILHSIASRGDEELAMAALRRFRLDGYFLVPQVNWSAKSQSILTISKKLQIALEAMAFIDDDPFEREQVCYMFPPVLTFAPDQVRELPSLPVFTPGEITSEAGQRRQFYQAEIQRELAERDFATREEFLLSCKMQLSVRTMTGDDIPRVLELMTRTHQLNTTGLVWERAALTSAFEGGANGVRVVVAELRDRFGWYGIVGAAIVEAGKNSWRLKYLAVSCRVMGRGIERALLATLARAALNEGYVSPEAEFRDTGRNRMMRALYQMMGFTPSVQHGEMILFRARPEWLPAGPRWVEVL